MVFEATPGNALIFSSFLLSLLISLLLIYSKIKKEKKIENYSLILIRADFILIFIAVLLLAYYLYLPDFNYYYVFRHVSKNTELFYRITALWVGQEGVFLIWSFGIILACLIFAEKHKLDDGFKKDIIAIAMISASFFLSLAILMTPFKTTLNALEKEADAQRLSVDMLLFNYEMRGFYKEGNFINGMQPNPALLSPYMALHPPLVFLAYAFLFIPFGACLSYFISKKKHAAWHEYAKNWLRVSWLLLSSGIILGSIWAYEELSFGGYWTWDPIETASLIPWFGITMLLHSTIEYSRTKKFAFFAPFLGVFIPFSLIYATFITRSGLIKSSHQYAKTIITPLLEAAIVIVFLVLVFIFIKNFRIKKEKINVYSNYFATFAANILMLAILGVLFYGISYPLFLRITQGKEIVISRQFYNEKTLIFVVGMLITLGYCSMLGVLKKKILGKITLLALSITLIFQFANIFENFYLNLAIPSLAFAFVSLGYRILRRKKIASYLLHLGVALILLGVFISSSLMQSYNEALFFTGQGEIKKSFGSGYEVKVDNINVYQKDNNWVQEVEISIYKNGELIFNDILKAVSYADFGLYSRAKIKRGVKDVYVVFRGIFSAHAQGGAVIPLEIKIIPLASLIWIGCVLMIVSMIYILYRDIKVP